MRNVRVDVTQGYGGSKERFPKRKYQRHLKQYQSSKSELYFFKKRSIWFIELENILKSRNEKERCPRTLLFPLLWVIFTQKSILHLFHVIVPH